LPGGLEDGLEGVFGDGAVGVAEDGADGSIHAWIEAWAEEGDGEVGWGVEREDFEVVLVHSGARLLPTLGHRLGEYAGRQLQKRGLRLILERRVKAVTAHYVTLDNGDSIPAGTVISTIGNAPHPVVRELAEAMDLDAPRGRLRVDSALRVPGTDWLWSAGDCAVVPKAGGGDCPPTAQFATREGTLLGKNLLAVRVGKEPKPFAFKGLGELAAIGHRTAVAEIFGRRFSGFLAWWMWRSIYLSKLPGVQRKLRVMVDWTFDLFFPRDINLLNPRYSKMLKEVHLESGDVLFNPGEPAFSLYFVQQGAVEIRHGDRLIKRVPKGEYFGERALLEDRIWRFRAVATEPTRLIALAAHEFHAIVSGSRALETLFKRSAQAYRPVDEVESIRSLLGAETLATSASELVNREVDTLRRETPLEEALQLFRDKRHGSYPLLDEDGKSPGVIQRDALFDRLKSGWNPEDTVASLPVAELPALAIEETGGRIVEVMTRSGRNKILVTDAGGSFVGLVTIMDLLEHSLERRAVRT